MKPHPSRGMLRRLQDEPELVAERDRLHLASCPTCRSRSDALGANAAAAAALLADPPGTGEAVDPVPALRELRSNETSAVPPKPRPLERLRSRLELGRGRVLRAGAVLVVIATALGTLAATGVAGNFLKIFEPDTFVAVPIDFTTLGTLPDLSGYGTTRVLQSPEVTTTASLGEASTLSGLHLLATGALPTTVKGEPTYYVVSAGRGSFTFDAAAASGTAGRLGRQLPALPPGLDGSTLTLAAGPIVVKTVGSQTLRGLLPHDAEPPSAGPGAAGPGTSESGKEPGDEHGGGFLRGLGLGGIPQLVVVQMKAPALYSDGPSVAQYEEALLSMPGVPASLGDQIRSLGNLSSTLPIPVPTSLASSHTTDINGATGLVIGDRTGIASGVIWQSHGIVYGVAGTLSDKQVVAIARSLH